MKRSTVVLGGVLLACAGGALGWQYLEERRLEAEMNEAQMKAQAAQAAEVFRVLTQRPFIDNAMAKFLPKQYTRPASEWQSSEKAFYEKIASSGKFDVLVVPFQVAGWGLDKSARSIMTAELALGISQFQKVKVPDPFLVAKALGDGQRQLKHEDIYRLADAIGAKRIVRGFAGHDRAGKMTVAILTQDYEGTVRKGDVWTSPVASKKFENIAFGDEVPAIQAYESVLPEILKSVGANAAPFAFAKADAKLEMTELPPSPFNLIESTGNPAQDAYGFLLYSALTPNGIDRTKRFFAEKAYLALLHLSPASPEYRALLARTYMALGLRLAAIKVLGEPQTSEEKEVLAALNGNLPEVRALATAEAGPLKRLLQKLDENEIARNYRVLKTQDSFREAAALKLPGPIWPFIVTRAFVEWDPWRQYNNAALKSLLDHEMPVKGQSLEDMARGFLSQSDPDKVQTAVDLSVFHHGRQFIEVNAAKACCEFAFSKPGQLDYLELLQAIGHDNLIRRINFLSDVQGIASKALSFANSIEGVYKGHPYYALERSQAEVRMASSGAGAEKQALYKAALENALNAAFWEQGQSPIAAAAYRGFDAYHSNALGPYQNFYYTDVPYSPDYVTAMIGYVPQTHIDNAIAGLKNATSQVGSLLRLVELHQKYYPDETRDSDLLAATANRFVGAPQRNNLLGIEARWKGEHKVAEAYFRENIRHEPNYWQAYVELAHMQLDLGDPNAAAKVLHSYAGFKKGGGDGPVSVAGHAYQAGSYFYNAGNFDLARPFYQMAASQGSGASSEMVSATRLQLLAGDVQGAMVTTLQRAQRYQDAGAYRDYLGLLHASDQSKEAWAGFWVLMKEKKAPAIWDSALVGHHRAALSEAEVMDWLRQDDMKSEGVDPHAAAIYLMRYTIMDRTPSANVSKVIDALDLQRWKIPGGTAMYGELRGTVGKTPAKSGHAYFVDGYRALKLKDFAAAHSIFTEALGLWGGYGYLPYYAFAAAKAGNTADIETGIARVKASDRNFDYYLAQAIFAGASGKNDEALRLLELARYHRPGTRDRYLLTEHTLGEISELLAEMTGSEKIRARALDWAQKRALVAPWQSWSHAQIARLSKNPAERQRAIAMLAYLDPKSETLSKIGKAEIDASVKAFGETNPLLKLAPKVVKKEAI